MGLLREGNNMALRILRTVGIDPKKLYSAVVKKLNEAPTPPCPAAPPLPHRRAARRALWRSIPVT